MKVKDKIEFRNKMIRIAYRFFLLNEDANRIKQNIFDDSQFDNLSDSDKEKLENLIDYIPKAITKIEPFLSEGWRWNRIPKMIQSILCVSLYEYEIIGTERNVIINESIELTRAFLPSWNEKFVNAVLDKATKEGELNE